jgi:hypothetical protein
MNPALPPAKVQRIVAAPVLVQVDGSMIEVSSGGSSLADTVPRSTAGSAPSTPIRAESSDTGSSDSADVGMLMARAAAARAEATAQKAELDLAEAIAASSSRSYRSGQTRSSMPPVPEAHPPDISLATLTDSVRFGSVAMAEMSVERLDSRGSDDVTPAIDLMDWFQRAEQQGGTPQQDETPRNFPPERDGATGTSAVHASATG